MEKVLNMPMGPNDANAPTIKKYLMYLLLRLWEEEEGFSGKRPFGNSGWKLEIYDALYPGNLTDMTDQDKKDCDRLINAAIRYLCI